MTFADTLTLNVKITGKNIDHKKEVEFYKKLNNLIDEYGFQGAGATGEADKHNDNTGITIRQSEYYYHRIV